MAIGSTLATAANLATPPAHALVVLGLLYLLQAMAALARRTRLGKAIDNAPLLLMAGPEILHDNLRHVRITEHELMSQLRSHGVLRLQDVRAVIMESSGSLSVLTGAQTLDPELLAGVREADRLRRTGR